MKLNKWKNLLKKPKVVERPKSMLIFRRAKLNFKPKTEKSEEVIINEIEITSSADSIKQHFLLSSILIPFFLIRLL